MVVVCRSRGPFAPSRRVITWPAPARWRARVRVKAGYVCRDRGSPVPGKIIQCLSGYRFPMEEMMTSAERCDAREGVDNQQRQKSSLSGLDRARRLRKCSDPGAGPEYRGSSLICCCWREWHEIAKHNKETWELLAELFSTRTDHNVICKRMPALKVVGP